MLTRFSLPSPLSFSRQLDFVRGLLQLDPAQRPTGQQLLDHPYFAGLGENTTMVSDG